MEIYVISNTNFAQGKRVEKNWNVENIKKPPFKRIYLKHFFIKFYHCSLYINIKFVKFSFSSSQKDFLFDFTKKLL